MAKGIWGIDVSKCSIKAVRLELGKDNQTLTRTIVLPFQETGEGSNLDDQIRTTLQDLKVGQKIGGEPVIFSLPSHSTFNRLIKLPPVDDAKIPEVVRYEAQSQIPFNIDEVIWDYQHINRKYNPGEEKEVIIFAIKRDIVEQFLGNIEEIGFNVDGVQFAPVALFNFLLWDQNLTGASVALDMGGDNTDLIVIDESKFWVRNLPITGNDITKALQKSFNIPFPEAEKLKLKAGQSQQPQKIFNAIQPVLRDLVSEINRSMGYYKSISRTSRFEKIFLMGNSTKTLNFQRFLSQSLQMPAARVQNLNKILVGGQLDKNALEGDLNTLGTAIGLALQGTGATVNRVNLLPPIYAKKKELKKKQPMIIATAAALAILVGLMWWKTGGEADALNSLYKRGDTAKRTVITQDKEMKGAKAPIKQTQDWLDTVASLSWERDLILKVMDKINPNIPTNNGDWNVPQANKIWVVDWKFLEEPKDPVSSAVSRRAALMKSRTFPTKRILKAVLEVVITKRRSNEEGRSLIIQKLLNWDPAKKTIADSQRPCVIKNEYWELDADAREWRVELDNADLERPLPNGINPKTRITDLNVQRNFARYRITLKIPVGGKDPKAEKETKAASK